MSKVVGVDQVGDEISLSLLKFNDMVIEGTKSAVSQIAEQCKNNIVDASPVLTGKYKKGWKIKKDENAFKLICTIHNKNRYQLTHLLENGHLMRNGVRTKAFPHIRTNAQKANLELADKVEEIVENAGH